jgi:hypothetical protein
MKPMDMVRVDGMGGGVKINSKTGLTVMAISQQPSKW